MREALIERKTNETDIKLSLNLDGEGQANVNTGCGFLDHMLTLFARHGGFDLEISCIGDKEVDFHHTTEDVGISLGLAFKKALGDNKGIYRYGSEIVPMDESLVMCAVDICGRALLVSSIKIPAQKVGDFDTELVEEFFLGFVRNAQLCLHINEYYGTNSHHIIEGTFKAFGRAMRKAVAIDEKNKDKVLSTKGVL